MKKDICILLMASAINFLNGQLHAIEKYEDEVETSQWKIYDENGIVIDTVIYKDGIRQE